MVALLILLVVLADVLVTFLFIFVSLVTLVLRLQTALLLVLGLCTESGLGFAHLVELLASCVVIIFEDLVLLVPVMLFLQLFDDRFGFLLSLRVFQVVHVQLILEVVNVGVLLNIDVVESL